MLDQETPALLKRSASWRGPRPASRSRAKSLVSISVAFPPLPLPRTVKRKAILSSPANKPSALRRSSGSALPRPEPVIQPQNAAAEQSNRQTDGDQSEIVFIAK